MRRILFSRAALCGAVCALVACCLFAAADADAQAPGGCTKTLAAGGDLSTFLGTLSAGDTGCLRAGTYADGCSLTWSRSGTAAAPITLRSYPGETATIQSPMTLSGDFTTAQNLVRAGVPTGCGTTNLDGFKLDGDHNAVLDSTIHNIPRHGVLQGTTSSDSDISRNLIHDVAQGCASSTQEHGIYLKTSGRATRNVVYNVPCGYGIQAYQHPHDLLISGNVTVNSGTRAGVVLYCDTNCDVVNHISVGNANGAVDWRTCLSGCTVDHVLSWDEGADPIHGALAGQATGVTVADPQFVDSGFRVAASSPAVDAGRADLAAWPDMDGVLAAAGATDLGAYELQAVAPGPTPTPSPTPSPTPEPTPDAYAPACAPTCDEQITDLRTENTRLEGDLAAMTASRDDWRARALKAEDQVARILAVAQE